MRLKNTASQPTSPYSCHLPSLLVRQEFLAWSSSTVIDTFYKYTKQDGECGTLSKDELKELLEKEFRPILKVRTMYQD